MKSRKAEDNVSSGDVIRVVRIRTEEITENGAVAYSTVYEDTEELYEGETETKTEGVEGEAKVTYTVTYADGEEENRVVKTKEVLKEAKSAVQKRSRTSSRMLPAHRPPLSIALRAPALHTMHRQAPSHPSALHRRSVMSP